MNSQVLIFQSPYLYRALRFLNSSSIRRASLSSFLYFFRQIQMSINRTTSIIIIILMLALTSDFSVREGSLTLKL